MQENHVEALSTQHAAYHVREPDEEKLKWPFDSAVKYEMS